MIYGGTIEVGYSKLLRKPINISTCYEASGAYVYNSLKQPDDGGDQTKTKDDIMDDIEQHACPGAGACGGMYVRIVGLLIAALVLQGSKQLSRVICSRHMSYSLTLARE